MIDKQSPIPIYYQLKEIVKSKIERGEWKPLQCIPSQPELARKHEISQMTARHAVNELVSEGFLYREKGRGTFVSAGITELGENRSYIAGLIMTDIMNAFFPPIIKTVEGILAEHGYSMLVCNTSEDVRKMNMGINRLRRKGVDGFIITPVAGVYENNEAIQRLRISNIPVVLLDRYLTNVGTDYVICDNEKAQYDVIKHLIDLGHKRIGYIFEDDCTTVRARLEGYRKAVRTAGLSIGNGLLRKNKGRLERGGYKTAKEFLRMRKPPTAIAALNDAVAIGAMDAVFDAGLSVPEDISIAGYDDVSIASRARVPLTTVRVPREEMGKEAANLLMRKITGKDNKSKHIVLKATLIRRRSSAPL